MSSFEEAYEETGHGIFNHLALLTCGFILLFVTSECLGVGYMLNKAECDLKLTISERGLIGASTFIGVVSTAIVWGYLGDACGRRRVMLPAILAAVAFSLGSSLAVEFWVMFVLRLLTGCFISASAATVYAYLGELHTLSHRAPAVGYVSAFIAFSFVTMPGLAWIILPQTWSLTVSENLSIVPWRVFMWADCFWGVLAAIGLFILPESPRYLLMTKGPEVVVPVLSKMYAWNLRKKQSEYPVTSLSASPPGPKLKFLESLKKLKYLIRPPLLQCVLLSHTCIFLLFMQTNAFYVWMPLMMNELLNSNTTSISMCDAMNIKYSTKEEVKVVKDCDKIVIDSRMYPISMVMGVLIAIIYVSIGYVINKWGRKRVYCGLVIFCSALTLCSGVVPHVNVAMALLVPGMCGGAGTSVLAALAIEIFPTSLRAMALCTLFMVARLGAVVGTNLLGLGLQHCCVFSTIAFTLLTAGSTLLMILWPDGAKVRAEMEAKNFSY